ncbi:hypothetical protein A2533_03580 [Candidatus Falkowbacteria bacterium RIFOXYD2_FULL_35_9]|uniref:Uncharacterized protein n=1 Tax=Candidatus Falkowbacteria bacterium RIFOXYC2_FULL_36_12 TaxID=1798002 RepID=A0A1F5T0B6_9BACT|nr:MAG: hypothetical protein A2478_03735 [Candidatus Falkowbacteria bacterium RIFOXYC2_FULL_36_12]OGF34022.1 MAG: hypothetical protein A2223_03840 [Candidatus Falkowbacteria bacterium RIFOXYA2_FULL_35_8]OGF47389.1 MAG: hypothetical protein A2533_03580 [Candidatus Falkowbacteria bacterium RIFOXYD2_FULL_35_9]
MAKNRLIEILKLLANDVAGIFPYILCFYFIARVIAKLIEIVSIDWTLFNVNIFILLIIALISPKLQNQILDKKLLRSELKNKKLFLSRVGVVISVLLKIPRNKVKNFKKTVLDIFHSAYFQKSIIIAVVVLYFAFIQTDVMNILAIFYALILILFKFTEKSIVWLALACFAVTVIFTVFDQFIYANLMVINTFYLLTLIFVMKFVNFVINKQSGV